MSHQSAEEPVKGRIKETVFPGRSPWRDCLKYFLLAVAVGVLTAELAMSDELRGWWKVEATAIRWAAGLSGGATATLLVVSAWMWIGRLQWVAVSPAGLRWYTGRRLRARH